MLIDLHLLHSYFGSTGKNIMRHHHLINVHVNGRVVMDNLEYGNRPGVNNYNGFDMRQKVQLLLQRLNLQ